jgi:hypothetical protein
MRSCGAYPAVAGVLGLACDRRPSARRRAQRRRRAAALGFAPQHVFHSIRKTFVSRLKRAGGNENTTADIVGRDKPRISYGIYFSGPSIKEKAEATKKIACGGRLAMPV